jgi:ketosteroid isomerase-like protein
MTVSEQDRQDIAAIVDAYRQAFAEVDMQVFMAAWDRDYGNLIYVAQERAQPVRGWAELERYFATVEDAFARVTTMTIDDLSIDVLGDVAYAFFTYHFEAEAAGEDPTVGRGWTRHIDTSTHPWALEDHPLPRFSSRPVLEISAQCTGVMTGPTRRARGLGCYRRLSCACSARAPRSSSGRTACLGGWLVLCRRNR